MDKHQDAYFCVGDTISVGKSASVPEATVIDIEQRNDTLQYYLSWSNGITNFQPVSEMDKKAVNKTSKR